MMNVHEILLPNVISSDSKERIKLLLNSKKGRAKFISKLDHFNAFENKYITNLPSNFTTEMILEYLKKKGASDDCYILSSMSSLDKRNLLLRDALDSVYGRGFGCIISCVPGGLLYYEGEDMRVIMNAIQI